MDQSSQIAACIPRLRRYARALVNDRTAADDLVQDTLERAWTRIQQFRAGTDLRAWMFSIMHNVHLNQVRSRRDAVSFDEEVHGIPQRATQSDALEMRDMDRAMQALPVEQREVLLLVALEDLSYEEVAKTLGIPLGTVMSRLSRARERVRSLMNGIPVTQRLVVVK